MTAGGPEDRLWALREASTSFGLMPQAKSVVEFVYRLEGEGLLRKDGDNIWMTTEKGIQEMKRLEREQDIQAN